MLCRFAILVLFVPPFTCDYTRADERDKDQEKLQGTWKFVEAIDDGKAAPQELIAKWAIKIAGDKMTVVIVVPGEPEESHSVTFKLDSTKKPKASDAVPQDGPQKGKTLPGIYEIEGDSLKICLPNKETANRPTEFASPKKSDLGLMVLKRSK
jgi:uncharacterized protein (TIGR03067 family)